MAMSAMIRPLLICLCLLVGCRDTASGGEWAGPGEQVSLQPGPHPLSPTQVIFIHVEDGLQDKTDIDTPGIDFWRRRSFFANLAINEFDPAVAPLVQGTGWYPSFWTNARTRRLHLSGDVLQSLAELKGRVLHPERLAVSHIYLVPVRSEYVSLRTALADHGIDGLSPVADVSPDCSYARFSNDAGDRQFSVMFLHENDGSVDLNEAGDRECIVAFFARNWGIDSSVAESLIFGDEPRRAPDARPDRPSSPIMTSQGTIVDESGIPIVLKRSGKCVLAQIITPPARIDWTVDTTDGCPTPPQRRAAMVSAYVQAAGVGVPADAIPAIQRQIRQVCGAERTVDELQDTEFKC